MHFSAYIHGKYIQISHHTGQLTIQGTTMHLPYPICSLSVTPDRVFVVYATIRGDGFPVSENIPANNIEAFDFYGRSVWRMDDIWTKREKREGIHFISAYWYTGETLSEKVRLFDDQVSHGMLYRNPFEKTSVERDHEYLECHAMAGIIFYLDLTQGTLLCSQPE